MPRTVTGKTPVRKLAQNGGRFLQFHHGTWDWKAKTSATGKRFPRVQLLTIAALLVGTARAGHPDCEPDLNFKKAKSEARREKAELR